MQIPPFWMKSDKKKLKLCSCQSKSQHIIHIIHKLDNIMSQLSWQLQIGIQYTFCKDITIMYLICSMSLDSGEVQV